ncbi:transposase IS4 [Hamiltosporidium tvaerminnensis]|uniref:Transposase IS4 n=1 Tax=Hamiltosporidium tvaerminnensis TaxID=1176355 RepID=A0A4Q9M1K7_9MICR|nr:transposase IS4 [Hamiltosporidium tvaerminnensis]
MSKKDSRGVIMNEIDSSDDEFFMDSFGDKEECDKNSFTNFVDDNENEENDNDFSSDSDIIVNKRSRTLPLPSTSSSEEDVSETRDNRPWKDVTIEDNPPKRFDFISGVRNEGPQISVDCTKPLDFFKLFFTDELIEKIVTETNRYARNKITQKRLSKRSTWHSWVDVTVEEFRAFLGVVLNAGTITLANIQEYWTKNFNAKKPFFGNILRRERFLQIFWMLHLNKNNPNDKSLRARTQKVRDYLDFLDERFKENFVPSREISVDESVVGFKGKISFLTYNPNKPTKWGIRMYVMADAYTGYVYSILPYYGSLTSEDLIRLDLPVSTRIVLELCNKLLDSNPGSTGYHIFTDRYYTSLPLAQELLKLNFNFTGTIQSNRKFLPDSIKKPRFSENNTFACRSGNILLSAWKDKRIVLALSSWDVSGTEPVNRVDRADSYATSYCFLRKSLKWWRKLFFWGLEASSVNAYLLYKIFQTRQNKRPINHLKFVREIVDGLTQNYREGSKTHGRPSTTDKEERLNGKLHIMRQNEGKKDSLYIEVIMRSEMHEEPKLPLKEAKREEDGAKNYKPKNKAPLISQGGTTLEEPTNNINEQSDLEEETAVVKEVEENIKKW